MAPVVCGHGGTSRLQRTDHGRELAVAPHIPRSFKRCWPLACTCLQPHLPGECKHTLPVILGWGLLCFSFLIYCHPYRGRVVSSSDELAEADHQILSSVFITIIWNPHRETVPTSDLAVALGLVGLLISLGAPVAGGPMELELPTAARLTACLTEWQQKKGRGVLLRWTGCGA